MSETPGRTFAIGDVHGCYEALTALLGTLALAENDTVVFLGDAVDRGPESKQVVNRILSLRDTCRVVFIMGNHEEMMRNALSGRGLVNQWLQVGGQATVDSYGGSLSNVPPEHIRFLVSGLPFWESDANLFVHASLEANVSLANQTSDYLRWKHLGGLEPPHISGKRVICGHTSQTDGRPLVFDGWVCVDTYAHGGQWLTALNVDTDEVFQAAQDGSVRQFPLTKYV